MKRSIPQALRQAAAQVREAVELGAGLAWLLADHVRRRLTGRPGLFDELFSDLDFGLEERDVMPPFDGDEPPPQEARAKPTARRDRNTKARR